MSLREVLKRHDAAGSVSLQVWVVRETLANGVKVYAMSGDKGWSRYPTLADVERVLGESAKEGWK